MTASISVSTTDKLYLKLSETPKTVLNVIEKYILGFNNVNESDMNFIINYLCDNSKKLNYLLRKIKRSDEKIQTMLDLFSFYKRPFSKMQVKLYGDYMELKNGGIPSAKENLSIIGTKKKFKNQVCSILDSNADLNYIAKELGDIIEEQNKAIKKLTKINSKALKFLKTFGDD